MDDRAAAVYTDPATLIPWEKNPRINDGVVAGLARSIEEYGFGAPIVARLANRMIIAGHTRWKAARKLGLKEVPVRFLDISEAKAKALALADNRIGEEADWNEEALREVLLGLQQAQDVDLATLGWAHDDLSNLLSASGVDSDGPADLVVLDEFGDDDENEVPGLLPLPEDALKAPFQYFGGKRTIAGEIWARFGKPKQYIEPFCGSAAILLAAPEAASLEVVNDASGFIANFWRAVVNQPGEVARFADYLVSHVDLGARHRWLMEQRERIGSALQDANWPGDAKVAGWWLWGQCAWIGSGWCDWNGQIPHVSNAGRGVQAIGQIPHVSDAGMGDGLLTSGGRTAWEWLHRLAARLERVRVIHGEWSRCLNHHYGGNDTAVFLDPPYLAFEKLYGVAEPVASAVATWAREHEHLRIALCGHVGDYDLPGWQMLRWSRGKFTYGSQKTTARECVWFSPACLKP